MTTIFLWLMTALCVYVAYKHIRSWHLEVINKNGKTSCIYREKLIGIWLIHEQTIDDIADIYLDEQDEGDGYESCLIVTDTRGRNIKLGGYTDGTRNDKKLEIQHFVLQMIEQAKAGNAKKSYEYNSPLSFIAYGALFAMMIFGIWNGLLFA
ncbi:MAG: hypothetical protein Q4G13_05480 [Moraxella sp.]|nr:hypothetical protein [Moraxella sp.]